MRTIWKYELEVDDLVLINVPAGGKILHVGCTDDSTPTLWIEVDPSPSIHTVERLFRIYGTGHTHKDENQVYVGTVITLGGRLVWHIYEATP